MSDILRVAITREGLLKKRPRRTKILDLPELQDEGQPIPTGFVKWWAKREPDPAPGQPDARPSEADVARTDDCCAGEEAFGDPRGLHNLDCPVYQATAAHLEAAARTTAARHAPTIRRAAQQGPFVGGGATAAGAGGGVDGATAPVGLGAAVGSAADGAWNCLGTGTISVVPSAWVTGI